MAKKIINVVYDVDDRELKQAKKDIQDVEKETKKSEDGFKKLGATGAKAWGMIASAAAAIGLASIAKEVIEITSEFQKLSAVLTNTLGSRSQAQQALKMIKDFAAQTPFSVVELTNSFVKLANQGFKPTIQQLRSLGDLASSQGKAFDQLTEAIIDAQTGEFERLKEFGIRASKEGDNVTFTFKGVQTQAKFTSEAIREYVLSLGDAQGVSGSMAAISETLGGRISNLGDSWDTLLNTIGDGNKGILANTIALLSDIITEVNELIKTSGQLSEEYRNEVIGTQLEAAKEFAKGFKDQGTALEFFAKSLERQAEILNTEYADTVQKMLDQQIKWTDYITGNDEVIKAENRTLEAKRKALGDQYNALIQSAEAIREYSKQQENANKKTEKTVENNKKLTKSHKEINIELDNTSKKIEETFDKVYENSVGKQQKALSALNSTLDKHASKFIETEKAKADKVEEIRAEAARKEQDRQQAIFDLSIQLGAAALEAALTQREVETQSTANFFNEQIELAGDNERKKEELAIERDRRLAQAEERNKEIQKRNARSRILIDTAVGVIKTFAQFGYPAGILPASLLTGISLIALANVRKYKDGEVDIDGPGTTTSDSIPARLSKGESVINAKATAASRNLLEAINDRKIDDRILQVAANGGSQINVFDDSRIIAELQRGKVDYEVHGYTLMRSERAGSNFKRIMRAKNQGY